MIKLLFPWADANELYYYLLEASNINILIILSSYFYLHFILLTGSEGMINAQKCLDPNVLTPPSKHGGPNILFFISPKSSQISFTIISLPPLFVISLPLILDIHLILVQLLSLSLRMFEIYAIIFREGAFREDMVMDGARHGNAECNAVWCR